MVISIVVVNYIWSLWRQSKSIRPKLNHIGLLNDLLLPFLIDYAAIPILHLKVWLLNWRDWINVCRLISPEPADIRLIVGNCGCCCCRLVQIHCALFGLFDGGDGGSGEVFFAGRALQVALLERAQTLPGFEQAGPARMMQVFSWGLVVVVKPS